MRDLPIKCRRDIEVTRKEFCGKYWFCVVVSDGKMIVYHPRSVQTGIDEYWQLLTRLLVLATGISVRPVAREAKDGIELRSKHYITAV